MTDTVEIRMKDWDHLVKQHDDLAMVMFKLYGELKSGLLEGKIPDGYSQAVKQMELLTDFFMKTLKDGSAFGITPLKSVDRLTVL